MKTGLNGRVAVVTGAASGIGLATAQGLAAEGCQIVSADLAATSPAYADDWCAVGVDVSARDAGDLITAAALERFGRLDVLVACAGLYDTAPLAKLEIDAFDRVQDVNVRGTLLCARAALAAMAEGGWGRIVLLSSIAVHTGGMAAGPAYVASKAAVLGLTRSLAHVAGPHGVTVNCVNPGIIDTPMTAAIAAETKRATAARTPLGRNGTPEEVASVIVMLCSEGASFVTGAHLDVNGGLAMT